MRAVEDTAELVPKPSAYGDAEEFNEPIMRRMVNYEPFCNKAPKFRAYPLSQLGTPEGRRVQEALVVKDLLDTMMGLEGKYIRYNNSYDPHVDMMPAFRISKNMDKSLKQCCIKILKLSKSYIFINNCIQEWSRPSYGCILHRLTYEIRKFLKDGYLRFIVERLEKEYSSNVSFSIRDMEHMINDYELSKKMEILYNLCLRLNEEMNRRLNMNLDQEDFNNFKRELEDVGQAILLPTDSSLSLTPKGGNIIKVVQEMIAETLGDRNGVQFLKDILNKIGEGYLKMFDDWLINGDINDPHEEFMIRDMMKDVNVTDTNAMMTTDRLWETRYLIRKDGLLESFHEELLSKILVTGKLLNIVKVTMELTSIPVDGKYALRRAGEFDFVHLLEGTNLELYVSRWYSRANELCIRLFFEGYNFGRFLRDIFCNYLYVNNGNKFNKFLLRNHFDLGKEYSESRSVLRRLEQSWDVEVDDRSLVQRLVSLRYSTVSFRESLLQVQRDEIAREDVTMRDESSDDNDALLRASNFENVKRILFEERHHTDEHDDHGQQGHGQGREQEREQRREPALSNIHYLEFDLVVPYPLNILINHSCMIQLRILQRYMNILAHTQLSVDKRFLDITKDTVWRYRHFQEPIRTKIVKRSTVLLNKMGDTLRAVQTYYTHTVSRELHSATNIISSESSSSGSSGSSGTISGSSSGSDGMEVTRIQDVLQDTLTNIISNTCLTSRTITIILDLVQLVESYMKFLRGLRRRLVQLDAQLCHRAQVEYDEDRALESVPRLVRYTEDVFVTTRSLVSALTESMTESIGGSGGVGPHEHALVTHLHGIF